VDPDLEPDAPAAAETSEPAPRTVGEVPLVEVVVVACDPGERFGETLRSIASQDYPALAVLVVDAAHDDPAELRATVASVLPAARVIATGDRNVSRAMNQVLEDGTGAPFVAFVHDDARLDSNAIRALVEETFRSNAGIAGAKLVDWSDERRLLQAGMATDKTAAPARLVDPGELDQEQHDAVRDVLYVPGGCTLVRTDLLRALGGFDVGIPILGEDLDLCWRAQVAGARVLVVPAARVAHAEALTGRLTSAERDALSRRHRVRTLLSCYSPFHLIRVVPQALVLAFAETLFALVTGHVAEARRVVGAWTDNVRDLNEIRRRRKALRPLRQVKDKEIRHLQVHGSARLSAYLRGQIGGSDDRFGGVGGVGRSLAVRLREPGAQRAVALWLAVVLVVLAGSRHLLTRPIPAFGEFVDFPATRAAALDEYRSAVSLRGLGGDDFGPALLGALGTVGAVVLGQLALLRTLVVVGSLLVGLLGAWRLAAPAGSRRAQMVALVGYAAAPVGFNAIARGHWSGLVAYALAPFVLARLARASGAAPFRPDRPVHAVLMLATLSALGALVLPAFVLVGPIVAVGLAIGSLLAGRPAGSARALVVSAAGAVGAVVLLAPASFGWFQQWESFGRPRQSILDPAGATDLLSFHTGPVGSVPLTLALLGAAGLALVMGRDWRLAWGIRGWFVALVCWALAFAATQDWLPVALPPLEVLLAPAAAGLALALAMGVASFEVDLREFHFGWRQILSVLAGAALVVSTLPVLGNAVVDGRWGSPSRGIARPLAFVNDEWREEPFRVLWLGDPEVLPLSGWEFDDGVTYQVTTTGLPEARDLFPPDAGGTDGPLRASLDDAARGSTTRLGDRLAPLGIRYVFLPVRVDPGDEIDVVPQSPLVDALPEQLDLPELEISQAVRVWENAAWTPGAGDVPTSPRPSGARTAWLVVQLLLWIGALIAAVRTRGDASAPPARRAEVTIPSPAQPAEPATTAPPVAPVEVAT
jgi:GT2 family glycosyltransferase